MHCVTLTPLCGLSFAILQIVPVTDILRAQQIQEDNEVQQTQQSTILQRYKSVSIGNLLDLPGEDDKKSIKNRMRMKCKYRLPPMIFPYSKRIIHRIARCNMMHIV